MCSVSITFSHSWNTHTYTHTRTHMEYLLVVLVAHVEHPELLHLGKALLVRCLGRGLGAELHDIGICGVRVLHVCVCVCV